MRKRYYFKVSENMPIPEMEKILLDKMKEVHKKLLQQSYRPVGSVIVRVNHDGDDFVNSLWTVLLEFKAYRIPRIVKNLLMRKHLIFLALVSVIFTSCATYKCYPSKKSKDWAVKQWTNQRSDGYYVVNTVNNMRGKWSQVAFECMPDSNQLDSLKQAL